LLAYSPVPELRPKQFWGSEPQTNTGEAGENWPKAAEIPFPEPNADTAAPARVQIHTGAVESDKLPLLRLVGQVAATYLIAEGPDGLYLIDQHAAHERVLFEQLMAQQNDEKVPAQTLLEPVNVVLPPEKARLLTEQLDTLQHVGFDVESFGPNTFTVRAIPALIVGGDPEAALNVVVEDFEDDETPLAAANEARITARICKRMAVKGGQILSVEEQQALLRSLEACQSPRTCPHGRPTMIHLSADLLERQFGRRGAR
jgi:DNA mismatch repair protein MutL